jgi:PilZ domain
MARKDTKEKRETVRIPYRQLVNFLVAESAGAPPNDLPSRGEIINISQGGMEMRTARRILRAGAILQAWIPVSEPPVTFPILTQVKWVRDDQPGLSHLGLRFMV